MIKKEIKADLNKILKGNEKDSVIGKMLKEGFSYGKNEGGFDEKLNEARKRVHSFDKIEGFKNRHISTIMSALKAGINSRMNEDCLFDAYVMLEEIK